MRRVAIGVLMAGLAMPALASAGYGSGGGKHLTSRTTGSSAPFYTGELAANAAGVAALTTAGCGSNDDGEPSVHASRSDQILVGSERGVGSGSDAWVRSNLLNPARAATSGGPGAGACDLHYDGQPNGVAGAGASGGDIDTAFGSVPVPGTQLYPTYVASLNLGSVSVSHSADNGTTWQTTPVQAGLPGDDREWIAALGLNTSLLTYHDIATTQIDVLRSDDMGATYQQISTAIPLTGPYGYAADDNELGNVVIDHLNAPAGSPPGALPSPAGFRAYQSFVAPSAAPSVNTKHLGCADPAVFVCANRNEAFVSVSNNGGLTWTPKPIPCSVSGTDLGHEFPNVSVAPNGNLWETWSDGSSVYAATSADQGDSWSCARASSGSHNLMPWIVAGASGEDLVYYGESGSTWSVMFAQNTSTTSPSGWSTTAVLPVHSGSVCELGFSCTSGRQLLDDLGVDVDFPAAAGFAGGYAHIAYSHDCTQPTTAGVPTGPCTSPPDQLGGPGTYTGYAVQTGGTTIGPPN